MRKIKLFVILFSISFISINAQNIEISPLFGYSVNGSVDSYYGKYDVKSEMVYGGLINIEFRPQTFIELSYRRSDPSVVNETPSFLEKRSFNIGVEHYHIGVLREFKDDQVKPFSQFTLGASRYFEKSDFDAEAWLFSINIGLGVKYFFSDKVGIRLQTNLFMPMEFNGVGVMCGFGSGGTSCGGGATFNVPILQWELAGALIFRIAN